jgi:hypothetical protein
LEPILVGHRMLERHPWRRDVALITFVGQRLVPK